MGAGSEEPKRLYREKLNSGKAAKKAACPGSFLQVVGGRRKIGNKEGKNGKFKDNGKRRAEISGPEYSKVRFKGSARVSASNSGNYQQVTA